MTAAGKLAGRVALVTGGSRGIGAAIALAFAGEGADVAFCHLDDAANADAVAADIAALERKSHHAAADVAEPAACAAFAESARDALGPIDILVNNAGICFLRPFEEVSVADYERLFDVHVKGTFFMTQAVYPEMVARGWGRIINISSQLAYKGAANLTPYCAAKGAISSFTRALAHEAVRSGVLVNAIAPGSVATDILPESTPESDAAFKARLPIGRFAETREIAPTAVLLASSDGDYYVGATLSPNGGDVMI